MTQKKAFTFTTDALMAITLIVIASGIVLTQDTTRSSYQRSFEQANVISEDSVRILSYIQFSQVNETLKESIISDTNITESDLEKDLIYIIGALWAENTPTSLNYAKQLAQIYIGELIPAGYSYSLSIDGQEIYSDPKGDYKVLSASRRLISGIHEGSPAKGTSTRISISNILSKDTAKFIYFGGFVGQGDITKTFTLPEAINSVTNVYIEMDAASNFTLSINNNNAGAYGRTTSTPMHSNNWTMNQTYYSLFTPCKNTIHINFTNSNLHEQYIGGGYIEIGYNTSQMDTTMINLNNDEVSEKYIFPGIDGLFNIYSSFYVPGQLNNMSISAHFRNNITNTTVFLEIGNATIFYTNESGEQTKTFTSAQILSNLTASGLDYNILSSKTIPIRFGYYEGQFEEEGGQGYGDAVLITDLSGSMSGCDVNSNCTGGLCDNSDPCHRTRINVAKEVNKAFVQGMLNTSGNRAGLVGYESGVTQYHELSNDRTSLESEIDSYIENGYTGTCVGIKMATEALRKPYLQTLVNKNSNWRYTTDYPLAEPPDDAGGRNWKNINFNDTSWDSGDAILGFCNKTGSWYNTSWNHRKSINIQNTAGDLTDYQVEITHDLSADYSNNKILQYCQDIRFTYYNSTDSTETEIPHWTETCDLSSSGNTVFWVKVPYLESNIDTTLYMYYGNSTASSASNATAVLEFFDDFDNLDQWQNMGASTWQAATAEGRTVLELEGGNSWRYGRTVNTYNLENTITEIMLKPTASNGDIDFSYCLESGTQTNYYGFDNLGHFRDRTGGSGTRIYVNGSHTDGSSANGLINSWLVYRTIVTSSSISGEYNSNTITRSVFPGIFTDHLALGTDDDGGDGVYIDWIRVRKYASPEPTVTIIETNISKNGGDYYFRKHFSINDLDRIDDAYLYVLSDDNAEIYVNGNLVNNDAIEHNATYWNIGNDNIFYDGFESGINTSVWTRGGSIAPYWITYNTEFLEGTQSTGNNDIGNNQESWIETTANITSDSTLLFNWKVSSEKDWDFISFYINNRVVSRIDGYMGWREEKFYLPVGNYTFKWRYSKNGGTSTGSDTGWIDNIRILRKYHLDKSYLKDDDNIVAVKLRNNDNESAKFDLKIEARLKRKSAMLVMSDGFANRGCGYPGTSDYNGRDATFAACDARDEGIAVYSVAFGSTADSDALKKVACWNCSACNNIDQNAATAPAHCWIQGENYTNCSTFYQSANADELREIYLEIAESMVNLSYTTQKIIATGDIDSTLYPDSYIEYNYTPVADLNYGEISLTFSSETFGETSGNPNIESPKNGSYWIPPSVKVIDAKATSYSSDYWTATLNMKDETSAWTNVYSITSYNTELGKLGDPFIVHMPSSLIGTNQTNYVQIDTMPANASISTGASPHNRIIYTIKIKGIASYGEISQKADGCTWTIEQYNGNNATIKIPSDYNGTKNCEFSSTRIIYDHDDSIDNAALLLLHQLDITDDNRIDIALDQANINIQIIKVTDIPWMWGPAILRLEIWK